MVNNHVFISWKYAYSMERSWNYILQYHCFPGMVFNISIGFQGLEEHKKKYALFVGDTVVVSQGGPASVITPLKKRVKHVGIFLKVHFITL